MLVCSTDEGAVFPLISVTLLWVLVEVPGPVYVTFAESSAHSVVCGAPILCQILLQRLE